MCLILFALNRHPKYSLVVLGNRDEFFARPTRPSEFWPEHPQLLAGKDLQAGGTWMGITRQGRFAALTNYRDPAQGSKPCSRGDLVLYYLQAESPDQYLDLVKNNADRYSGFNLLVGARDQLQYFHDQANQWVPIADGIHGLSNGRLNSRWPKVEEGTQALTELLENNPDQLDTEQLFDILNDRKRAPDDRLPDTGVGTQMEKALSSRFIHFPGFGYGTRSSTVLCIEHNGTANWWERQWNEKGQPTATRHFNLRTAPGPS